MDADLQHDEAILPAMLDRLRQERLDIVIGSRHTEGGSMANSPRPRPPQQPRSARQPRCDSLRPSATR